MTASLDRRRFLGGSLLGGCALLAGAQQTASAAESEKPAPAATPTLPKLKKAAVIGMLSAKLSFEDRFKLARDVGFEGVEADTVDDPKTVEAMRAAAGKAGLAIHSIMNSNHWDCPLSSPDPKKVAAGLRGMETSLRNAKAFGADTVLLVPGVVTSETRYADAYERSQAEIKKLLPLAAELGVVIAIENVWNRFLLSPLEFARYVDEFQSPALRAYFDVGNIVQYGYPEDWIRTLGKRIVKVHIKDFDRRMNRFAALYEGSVNWPVVRRALAEVGYSGWITAELPGGDEKYLRDVASHVDMIIAGE